MKQHISIAYEYLVDLVEYRLNNPHGIQLPKPKSIIIGNAPFDSFVKEYKLNKVEYIALLLALVPHLFPGLLSKLFSDHFPKGTEGVELGGVKLKNYRGIIPTGQTLQFIIGHHDPKVRSLVTGLFHEDHLFARKDILTLSPVQNGEPRLSGMLVIDQEYLDLWTLGKSLPPSLSEDFPAEKIETNLNWKDLILAEETMKQVMEIETWLKYNDAALESGLQDRVKPGYRVLLYGPPGTGKTMTAALLGKQTNKAVYRVDLSTMISKYVGETSKNIAKLFRKAKNKNWILFVDECESLFSIRTAVKDAQDKYTNQDASFLLQIIEGYPGLVVLASNLRDNLDQAFVRRFQSIIEFQNPSAAEREKIWNINLPKKLKLGKGIDIKKISEEYDVTGANILNIIHHVTLQTLAGKSKKISKEKLLTSIKREYIKERRMM